MVALVASVLAEEPVMKNTTSRRIVGRVWKGTRSISLLVLERKVEGLQGVRASLNTGLRGRRWASEAQCDGVLGSASFGFSSE